MSQWVCESIETQTSLTHGHCPPWQPMVGEPCHHLSAPVRPHPVVGYARSRGTASTSRARLAPPHASPLPRATTLTELARWTPHSITVWCWRCVLKAASGNIHLRLAWWVQAAFPLLSPPEDGTLSRVGIAAGNPGGGHRIPWRKRRVKASIGLGFLGCAALW